MKTELAIWRIREYISSAIRGEGGDFMRTGSQNSMVTGSNFVRAFRGMLALGSLIGSRLYFLADNKTAGLGSASVAGQGSVFQARQLLFYIGQGQVQYDGANVAGVVASSVLSMIKKSGETYAAGTGLGPFQAGHAQPSAPQAFAKSDPSPGQYQMNSAVTVVIWRVSSITGQVSLKSLPSNVVTLSGQSLIVQMPLPDTNGQTHWGIGVVKPGLAQLGVHYQLPISLRGEVAETALATINGYARAVEISWTAGALVGQALAPEKAFPPPPGQFAGVMNDVLFVEADGIIYVGEPGQIGSFPPSNALFPPEPAVHYLNGPGGIKLRFGKRSTGALNYVGGSPALEYQTLLENQGIEFPQNVAIGAEGRLMIWLGYPALIMSGVNIETEFANKVIDEFAGWENQTESAPVVPGYDARGQYECWCCGKKIVPFYVPKAAWCAPIDLTGKIGGDIVGAVTYQKKLYLTVLEGANLVVYQFDAGTGSVMVIQTSDATTGAGYGDTITEVVAQARVDNNLNAVKVEVIVDYKDAASILVSNSLPAQAGVQHFAAARENILNAKSHAVRVTMTSTGGDCGIDAIRTAGAISEVVL